MRILSFLVGTADFDREGFRGARGNLDSVVVSMTRMGADVRLSMPARRQIIGNSQRVPRSCGCDTRRGTRRRPRP